MYEHEDSEMPGSPGSSTKGHGHPTILVVDDDATVLSMLVMFLRDAEFVVEGVASGREAMDAVRRNPPDIVVTDLQMPDMDGITLLHQIKQYDPFIEVIVLTAHASLAAAVEAMRVNGAFDFLEKPLIPLERLQSVVERAFEHRERAIEARREQAHAEEVKSIALELTGVRSIEARLAEALRRGCVLFSMDSSTVFTITSDGTWGPGFTTIDGKPRWLYYVAPPPGGSIAMVRDTGRPIFVENTAHVADRERRSQRGKVRSFTAIPLNVGPHRIGVWQMNSQFSRTFDGTDRTWMERLAAHLALAVDGMQQLRDQQRLAAEARALATTDPLTGLLNRRGFDAALGRNIELASSGAHVFTVLVADLDHLKYFNDTFGHAVGDQAIKAVADALKQTARVRDVIARRGGDEFAAIFPDADMQGALALTDRLRNVLEKTVPPLPGTSVAVSLGTAVYGADGRTPEDLLAAADRRLYTDKQQRHVVEPS